MKKTHDLVATIGKYKDREGNEKKRYFNVGSVFVDGNGRRSIKLDAVPVGQEWSGWLSEYEVDREQGKGRARQESETGRPPREPDAGTSASEDDVPF